MSELTDADGYEVTEATIDQLISDPKDVSDDVSVNYWTEKGHRLYVNDWMGKLDKFSFYVDLETETAHCGNDAWEDKLSVTVEGDEIHVVCDESKGTGPSEKVHELTIVAELPDDSDETDVDRGEGMRCDGGEQARHVDDETIEAAINDHEDPSHPDAITAEDVKQAWEDIQSGVDEFWREYVDQIEHQNARAIAESEDLILLDTGEWNFVREEMDIRLDFEGETEQIMGEILTQIMHDLAAEFDVSSKRWDASYPFVLVKPERFEAGEQFVEAVVNDLQQRGLSPGQAWAYYGVEIRGNSMNTWGKRKGDHDHKNVSDALEKARAKLP